MSFELRTSLNTIVGFANLVKDEMRGLELEKQAEYMNHVLSSANEMLQLLDELPDTIDAAPREDKVFLEKETLRTLSFNLLDASNEIVGFAELIQKGQAGPMTAEQKVFIGNILKSASEMTRLINNYTTLIESKEYELVESEDLRSLAFSLRTALNGIMGFAELIHGGQMGQVTTVQQQYLGNIIRGSNQIAKLIPIEEETLSD